MKSFAIWIERTGLGGISTDNSRCPLEINFNYLTDCMEKGHHAPVLDFGIKYKHMEEMTNICLFVPFIIEKEEISDLGECLSQNKEILNSIFNENYTTHNVQSVSFCNVMEMGKTIFSVRTLDIEHDIELKEDYDGTIIKIQMKKPGEECAEKIYCRFRISSESLEELKSIYTPNNNILSSSFERNSYIDFRFNDCRTLEAGLIEKLQKKENMPVFIEKFHFLLITRAQVQLSASEQYTERSLNKELWSNYYSGFDPNDLIVANHWHKKAGEKEIREVSLLIRLKENVCTNITISIYLFILMCITIFFNCVSNWIWGMLTSCLKGGQI